MWPCCVGPGGGLWLSASCPSIVKTLSPVGTLNAPLALASTLAVSASLGIRGWGV